MEHLFREVDLENLHDQWGTKEREKPGMKPGSGDWLPGRNANTQFTDPRMKVGLNFSTTYIELKYLQDDLYGQLAISSEYQERDLLRRSVYDLKIIRLEAIGNDS
ncbi:hypothetical protein P7K49_020767 [Saguinus oedipus]|uniref:Uncharacterized protein n=1 Tax=Saguinus oedipus TaxID=9490 RepID=A0ABQ9UQP9_SAGOE|nr:hypothetical protein P7K49_020767 [Saguinus oedipus]